MNKVKNRKIIKKYSIRMLYANRTRNLITVLGIVLTTVLFTALFTMVGTMMKTQTNYVMRQNVNSNQAYGQYLSLGQYEKIRKDPSVKNVSCSIYISEPKNNKLKRLKVDINSVDERAAKSGFCNLIQGRLPKQNDEIATNTFILRILGIKNEIGAKVPVTFQINDKEYSKVFRLSGYWKGDQVAEYQQMFVSKSYAMTVIQIPQKTFDQALKEKKDPYEGRILCRFDFKKSFELNKQLKTLVQRNHLQGGAEVKVNSAMVSGDLSKNSIRKLIGVIALIGLSGYLIIYNIFYINVYSDIQSLALLKVLGTTGKQLRKVVRRQALYLSIVGVPVGLVIGWLIGCVMVPYTMQNLDYRIDKTAVICESPVIFIGAAVFAFATVYLGSIRPCHIVHKLSPIEAIHLNEVREDSRKRRKSHRLTPLRMALHSIRRSKLKFIVIIISLSLCFILFNGIYAILTGFDVDQFVSVEISDDLTIADTTIFQNGVGDKVCDGVNTKFIQAFQKRSGVKKIGKIYLAEDQYQYMDDLVLEKSVKKMIRNKEIIHQFKQFDASDILDDVKQNKRISSYLYGVDSMAARKVELSEGHFDEKKWATGKYIICSKYEGDFKFYHIGDKVTIRTPKGGRKQYTVMALMDEMTYSISSECSLAFGVEIVLPDTQFKRMYPKRNALRIIADIDPNRRDKIENWLNQYIEFKSPTLAYRSKWSFQKEVDGMKKNYKIVGGGLAFIIGIIGLLNFTGTMIASILARKNEFAIFEAIGMTGRQLKKMLAIEGGIYACCTMIVALIVDYLVQNRVVYALEGETYFFKMHYTVAPILCAFPILLLIVGIVPIVIYHILCKQSVVERLKVES